MMKTRPDPTTWTLIAASVTAFVLVACGGKTDEKAQSDPWGQPWDVRVESPVDTLTGVSAEDDRAEAGFPQDVDTTPDAVPVGTPQALDRPRVEETIPETRPEPRIPEAQNFTPGWRVQLVASSSIASADALAQEARARFTEPVYVEYEPPLYKVRVGNFFTKQEATQMATRARAAEFEAWVVETLVLRPGR